MRPMGKAALLVVTLAFVTTTASWAITPYSQDFETFDLPSSGALLGDNWKVFANVFASDGTTFVYNYGVFDAPNDGAAFCATVTGEGGASQGSRQLSVYSDYNNLDHTNSSGNVIETNVFQEWTIGVADVGGTVIFTFDAKMGNLAGSSTALAFIKTLNPAAGYAMTNFVTQDTTATPTTWTTYTIQLPIDAGLVGQILQIGFMTRASNNESSGVFYDNINQPLPVELVSLSVE